MVCIDILKQFQPQQEGKVYMKQDRHLKKRITLLDGSMNTTAQLNIVVNLRLNYLHFQVQTLGVFVISVNYQHRGQNYKVSISNLFKSLAYPHENQINQPCEGMPHWGTLVIDLKSFFSFTEITSINISGHIAVKNIYNTNEEQLLPTDCQLNSVHRILFRHVKPKLAPLKSILKNKGQKAEHAPLDELPLPQERVSPMKQEPREEIKTEVKSVQPIMKLKHIHGYTPKHQANVIFLDDNYFAFPCDKTIVIMSDKEQKFCSATNEIQSITKCKHLLYAACDSEIVTFDYTTCTKINHYKLEGYKTKLIQCWEDILVVLAYDEKHQMILIIKNEVVILKQASPFHIQTFKIQDKDNFISVGKENLRYWHIKETCLQGHSPYLGQYARETDFTDVLIQEKRVLGCCKRGRVFQFIDQELTGVWQISESPITTMNKFSQFVITTHKDGIKYWKQDFSEMTREIKSEVEVIGCDSRTRLVCAFRDKSIGIIDDKTIKYLVHSHQQTILDIALVGNKIVSSAMDHEIRIWNQHLSLEYQFRCLDGLATSLWGLQTKAQFIAAFDNGYIRVFDMTSYTVILEIDTKQPILAMSGNPDDTLFLITHDHETLILNSKLLIIKQHQVKCVHQNTPFAINGFFNDLYYIASSQHIKLYSCDHLAEKYHLNIPITSIDCNNEHIHIVSNGNIKRFDKELNFLQELISNSVYIKSCNNFIFNANAQQQLVVYDYLFRSDETGNPIKQTYQQHVKKLLISNQIISFVDDFIFIWDTNGVHNSMLTHPIDKAYIDQVIDVIQETMSPKKQKLEKDKTQELKGKENKKGKDNKKQEKAGDVTQQPSKPAISSPKNPQTLPGQHLNIQNQNKQLIIEEQQLPKIKIKKVSGYRFSDKYIQQFPWNQDDKFYVMPSEQFIAVNYYVQHQQQLILTNPIQAIHYSIKGIVVLLKASVLIFDPKMDLVKQFDYVGNLICSSVSPCGNYLLIINDDKIQIYILTSGRILTQTIIQYGNGNIFTDWCHDQDLMFVTLSGISNQLWRVNQRALLEYCELDIQPTYYQSSSYYKQSLIVSQGQTIHNIDIKQARTLLTVENATQQDITQVMCTPKLVVLFTNSPNIYLYSYEFKDKQIISLDSIPIGYSNAFQNDIIVATRSQVWFVDIQARVTVKIESNIPNEHKVLCSLQNIIGTSEGTMIVENDEILVPKRQCLAIQSYQKCIIAGYSDGFCRLFKDFKLIGQIQVGKCVTTLLASQQYFLVGNEVGQVYYCTGLNEIKMHEITQERGEFPIISIDLKDQMIAYTTANQKVQILHYKEKEEFIIKKGREAIDVTPEYYLMDSYRFRSIEQCLIQFSKTNPEQVIMLCNQIVIRNYIEHLNILTIDCNAVQFMQYNQYLIVGRKDGSVSMYDNEIELDKVNLSQFPIHMMQNNKIGYGNMVCELINQ